MDHLPQLITATFREIAIIHERMEIILKENLPSELPTSQFKLLNHLIYTTNSQETASQLAKNSHVSLSAMSQIIKQLSNKGYVSLQIRDHDARKKTILITEQGRIAHQNALTQIDIVLKSFAPNFSLVDIQQLFKLINQFRREFEQHT
ncbi:MULTISPECIES: MarR family winged helix-turn-helix transcriptional regulator [unclassified Agarivorans]|uniref:MarR family winged helix-turn-helix transcriptional regulator n=1 Tax=unclassified Agarivorans TaxID=2636026 RepID=UPI003D7DCC76